MYFANSTTSQDEKVMSLAMMSNGRSQKVLCKFHIVHLKKLNEYTHWQALTSSLETTDTSSKIIVDVGKGLVEII